jgi:hypothetical protein
MLFPISKPLSVVGKSIFQSYLLESLNLFKRFHFLSPIVKRQPRTSEHKFRLNWYIVLMDQLVLDSLTLFESLEECVYVPVKNLLFSLFS